ncbi:hypothetical protein FJ695_12070 [Labrenzia sp. PHM005]|nr:hypothetical protein FJ695_12070 [Labrenzia sp. PHM005]
MAPKPYPSITLPSESTSRAVAGVSDHASAVVMSCIQSLLVTSCAAGRAIGAWDFRASGRLH